MKLRKFSLCFYSARASVEIAYIVIMPMTLEGRKLCQDVQIVQRTRKGPIKNGPLADSESRCTSALNAEINLENISRKARCNLC
jgi:hypothetical protein